MVVGRFFHNGAVGIGVTFRASAQLRIFSGRNPGLARERIIALGVVALVMFVALVTYSPSDRGFSSTTDSVEVHNRIGPVGAWLADIFFFLFGRPAFLFPVMLELRVGCCSGAARPSPPG